MALYDVTLVGRTPLLMHSDNIEHADAMERWKIDPANKKLSKAGDDRSPAFRWLGGLYHDETHVGLPADNCMRCFMEGGALVLVPGGKSGKTFKAQTQSGAMIQEPLWPILIREQPVLMADLKALEHELDFAVHQATAQRLGFRLYVKRARIGAQKHIRVRPCFGQWMVRGTLEVWDTQLTAEIVAEIWRQAGTYKGLGDWRPGGKTPGPWGMFEATVTRRKG